MAAIRDGSTPISASAAKTKPFSFSLRFWIWTLLGFFLVILPSIIVADHPFRLSIIYLVIAAAIAGCVRQSRREWAKRNDLDYSASLTLAHRLHDLDPRHEVVSNRSAGMRVIQDVKVGEVSRHFDQRLNASVGGWLHHELGLHGWWVGGSAGKVGLGIGQVGISGTSEVDLHITGVMRDDLAGDGFVAILEHEQTNGVIDTIRVIVPSEPACRAYIVHHLKVIRANMTTGSHVESAFLRDTAKVAASFPCEVTRVSDQLRALLRQPPERRPTVTVVGADLGGAVILGCAFRVSAEGTWRQLFPLGLHRALLLATKGLEPPVRRKRRARSK